MAPWPAVTTCVASWLVCIGPGPMTVSSPPACASIWMRQVLLKVCWFSKACGMLRKQI